MELAPVMESALVILEQISQYQYRKWKKAWNFTPTLILESQHP